MLTLLLLSGCGTEGASTLRGQYVRTGFGQDVFIQMREDTGEAAFVFMEASEEPEMAGSFDDLETGDTIEIKVVLVSYDGTPNQTTVLSCERKKQGTEADVPSAYLDAITELDHLSFPG